MGVTGTAAASILAANRLETADPVIVVAAGVTVEVGTNPVPSADRGGEGKREKKGAAAASRGFLASIATTLRDSKVSMMAPRKVGE